MSYIAVDAGGVLYHKNHGGDQTDRSRKVISGAKEYLTKLKNEGHRLILVSFAGRKTAEITIKDLEKDFNGLFDKVFIIYI